MRLSSAIAWASRRGSKPCSSFCKVTRSSLRRSSEGPDAIVHLDANQKQKAGNFHRAAAEKSPRGSADLWSPEGATKEARSPSNFPKNGIQVTTSGLKQ